MDIETRNIILNEILPLVEKGELLFSSVQAQVLAPHQLTP